MFVSTRTPRFYQRRGRQESRNLASLRSGMTQIVIRSWSARKRRYNTKSEHCSGESGWDRGRNIVGVRQTRSHKSQPIAAQRHQRSMIMQCLPTIVPRSVDKMNRAQILIRIAVITYESFASKPVDGYLFYPTMRVIHFLYRKCKKGSPRTHWSFCCGLIDFFFHSAQPRSRQHEMSLGLTYRGGRETAR